MGRQKQATAPSFAREKSAVFSDPFLKVDIYQL